MAPASPLGVWSHPSGDGPAGEGSFAALGELSLVPHNNLSEAQVLSVLAHVTGDLRRWFIFPGEIDWLCLTFELSSRINLPLNYQERDGAAFSSSYMLRYFSPGFSSRDLSFSSVPFSLSKLDRKSSSSYMNIQLVPYLNLATVT